MVKVLLLSSEFTPRVGGIGTYVLEMAHAATELGHQVTVVAADYGRDHSASDHFLPFEVIRYRGGDHTMSHIPAKMALVQKLARQRPAYDVVHAVDWPFFLPLSLSPWRRHAHCVVSFHGTEIAFMQQRRRAVPLQMVKFWNGWSEFAVNSRDTAARLSAAFRPDPALINVTGLGVSQFWFVSPESKTQARAILDLEPGRFVIVTLGRVVARKGHLLLAKALALLPLEVQQKIHWHIIGPLLDPSYVSEIYAASSHLACQTVVSGALDAVGIRRWLTAADLFCLPGMPDPDGAVEGYGLVYLEAAACGTPALATRLGGVTDAVIDGETGLLVAPADAEALSAALLGLYRDPAQLAALAQDARRHAASCSWRRVVARTYASRRR